MSTLDTKEQQHIFRVQVPWRSRRGLNLSKVRSFKYESARKSCVKTKQGLRLGLGEYRPFSTY